MLELIDARKVGVVLVRDVARLSRDPSVAEEFLKKAIHAQVLIYANGRLFDSATEDLADLFGLRIQTLLAWFENRHRVKMMAAAKAAKVEQGLAVAGRPLGYVRLARGRWGKDPDLDIRQSVQRVFDLALECQSIGKLWRYMHEHQFRLPRRLRGEVVWERPARSSIANILKNPNYTPDYHYRRRRWRRNDTGPGHRSEFRPESEWLVARDHHEAYVSREQFQTIQASLASRRPGTRPPLGKGPALLQGIVWCAQCARWMWTSYHRRRQSLRLASYACRSADRWGQRLHHLVVPAELVDGTVISHVLAAVVALDRDTVLTVIERAQAEREAVHEDRQRLIQRAEADVRVAKQQYLAVGPEHHLVRADLEAAYEDAIRRRDIIKEELSSIESAEESPLTPADGAKLTDLTGRLDELWQAPTTTNEDRKQLLRMVLHRVSVLHATPAGTIELELLWASGLRESLRIDRGAHLDASLRALRQQGMPPRSIVKELRATGVPSVTGKPASPDIVRKSLRRLGLNRAVWRQQVLTRIRELLLEQRDHSDIRRILNTEFPLRDAQWSQDRLYTAIRGLAKGAPGVPPLPRRQADTRQAVALVEEWRKQGRTWRQVAGDLNAMGLRPAKAKQFSLFQVMEMTRRWRARHAEGVERFASAKESSDVE